MSTVNPPHGSLGADPVWQNRLDMATKVIKTCAQALGAAAAITTVGYVLRSGGERLAPTGEEASAPFRNMTSKIAIYVGDKLFIVGKKAFLAIATPIYIITWVTPKWILTQGLPRLVRWTWSTVIVPLARKIDDYVLEPFCKFVVWSWNAIVLPIGRALVQLVEGALDIMQAIARKICDYVLEPLCRGFCKLLKWSWQLIEEVCNIVHTIASKVCEHVLKPLCRGFCKLVKWSWDTIVFPAGRFLLRAIKGICSGLEAVVNKIYDYVLVPLCKGLKWGWNTVIIPMGREISRAVGFVKDKVVAVAQAIYYWVLKPLALFVGSAGKAIGKHGGELLKSVVDLTYAIAGAVGDSVRWLSRQFSGSP